jgi:hypothetical protein
MSEILLYAADLAAISLLTFGVYFLRHRCRDLVTAYLGVNVGVLAVSAALSTSGSAPASGSGCAGCCRSSGCARPSSTSTR